MTIGSGESGTVTVEEFDDNQLTPTTDVTLDGSEANFDFNNTSDTVNSAFTFTGGSVWTGTGTPHPRRRRDDPYPALSTATISGNLSLGTSEEFMVAQGGDLLIPAVVGGAGGIVKGCAGRLTLSASNDYSGGTTVNAGVLAVTNDNALGTGPVTDDAEVDLSNNVNVHNNFTIDSPGTAINSVSGNNEVFATITLDADTTIGAAPETSLFLAGTISGPGASF